MTKSVKNEAAGDAFFKAVASKAEDVAEQAAQLLTPADEDALLAWLKSDDADLRWWAVRGLALVGGEQSVVSVAALLLDDDPLMRSSALMALAAMQGRQAEAVQSHLEAMTKLLADDDGMVRQSASDALAQCGNDAVQFLAVVLQGEHQGARTRAAQALRHIATFPAAAILYRYLNDNNYMVHTYAYEGLDEMGLLETMLLAV